MSFAGKRSSGRPSASSAAARQLAGDASRDAALTRTDISVAPAVTVSNPRTGARVEQRREWDPDELMGDIKERTAYADASRSEWLSEWGERPTGAHENDRPAWRGGGLAPNRRTPPEAETRAARPRPVPIVPLGSTPSVGAAQIEADIRRWLVANRALHETKRITLIRVLGAGLQPEEPEEEGNDPGGRTRERGTRRNGDGTRRRRTINGLPLDASGRPVGVRATFPDPRYASVAPDGVPLPVEERTRFIPKPLPPSKRSYHPSAPLPLGPRASRDGTWDSPRDDPREIGDLEALSAEGRRAAPAATLTRAQFARAMAVGMGTPVSSHDVEDIFDTRAVSGLVPNETVLILEAFADAVLATPLRVMGGPGATIEDDGPERPESYAGKIVAPPCRTALFAPSDWNGAAARTSNAAPEEDLELEWAHGVSVAGGAGMLKWAPKWRADDPSSSFGAAGETRENDAVRKRAEGWWVYACGAMGVALETAATTPRGGREVRTPGVGPPGSPTRRASRSSQRFFRGHDERVTSLDVHPSGRWAATGQAGRVPQVAVWEIASGREVARVRLAAGDGRVAAVAFGPGDGDVAPGGVPARVVAVAADAKHTTRVWDWGGRVARRGATFLVHESVGFSGGGNGGVSGACWSPDLDRFATFGTKHVKLWLPRDASRLETGLRPQGGAARDAARTARLRERSARVGKPPHSGYQPGACGFGAPGAAEVADATCGAFVPADAAHAAGALVTGHADGTLVVWRGRRAARVVDAHPGAPTRCLALRTIVAEDKGDGEEGEDGGEARGERRREEEGEDGGSARPLVRVEIVTGSDGGTVRRWDLVDEAEGEDGARAFARSSSDDEKENENENERGRRLETEHVFAFQTGPAIVLPTDAPAVSSDASEYRRDDSGPDADLAFRTLPAPPRVVAVAAREAEIAAVTAHGDLWSAWRRGEGGASADAFEDPNERPEIRAGREDRGGEPRSAPLSGEASAGEGARAETGFFGGPDPSGPRSSSSAERRAPPRSRAAVRVPGRFETTAEDEASDPAADEDEASDPAADESEPPRAEGSPSGDPPRPLRVSLKTGPGGAPSLISAGHSGAAHDVAWHPARPDGLFAVASGSPRVVLRVADAPAAAPLAVWLADPFPAKARAVAFAPETGDPDVTSEVTLAVGTEDGDVRLLRVRAPRNLQTAEEEEEEEEEKDLLESSALSDPDSSSPALSDPDARYAYRCFSVARAGSGPTTATRFSPDGAQLAAASSDGSVYVFDVGLDGLRRARRCAGHGSAVVSIDWSPDSAVIRATDARREILHHDSRTGRLAVADFRDAEWATWTAPIGFQAMGVWEKKHLGSGFDVNAVDLDAGSRRLLAAGDDFGRVRLLRYPCVVPGAPGKDQIEAHAAHCSGVRWQPERRGGKPRRLVSLGGKDRVALQWRVVGGADEAEGAERSEAAEAAEESSPSSSPPKEEGSTDAPFDPTSSRPTSGALPASDARAEVRAALLARRASRSVSASGASDATLGYRRARLAELDAKMTALLAAARPEPRGARDPRPWTRGPRIKPRGARAEKDASRASRRGEEEEGEEEGERLEYVDGAYVWTESPGKQGAEGAGGA